MAAMGDGRQDQTAGCRGDAGDDAAEKKRQKCKYSNTNFYFS